MGGFAQICIKLMIGWLETAVSQVWKFFTRPDEGGLLAWIGQHWLAILIVLCVIGVLTDLIVYLFRWKPVEVWKSWLRRIRQQKKTPRPAPAEYEPDEEYGDDDDLMPAEQGPYFARNRRQTVPADAMAAEEPFRPDGNAARYEPADGEPETPALAAEELSGEYTDAGRRSAGDGSSTERNLEKMIQPRRRRIRVSELFSDGDDRGVHYEPPQPVIDRNEAYHAPVYPRNWRDPGDYPNGDNPT